MNNGLEIERKFLIRYPDVDFLQKIDGCKKVNIQQTYLTDRRRIRRWEEDGRTSFIVTFKEKINDIVRIEKESEISEKEFEHLMLLRDPSRQTITKTRYRFPFERKLLEVDVFDFWKDRAFLEIELDYEDEAFSIPTYITVIKEVTADKRYRNSVLAKAIPYEKI